VSYSNRIILLPAGIKPVLLAAVPLANWERNALWQFRMDCCSSEERAETAEKWEKGHLI